MTNQPQMIAPMNKVVVSLMAAPTTQTAPMNLMVVLLMPATVNQIPMS
jgi:hypothetical protein